jgi:hypothetical protein
MGGEVKKGRGKERHETTYEYCPPLKRGEERRI